MASSHSPQGGYLPFESPAELNQRVPNVDAIQQTQCSGCLLSATIAFIEWESKSVRSATASIASLHLKNLECPPYRFLSNLRLKRMFNPQEYHAVKIMVSPLLELVVNYYRDFLTVLPFSSRSVAKRNEGLSATAGYATEYSTQKDSNSHQPMRFMLQPISCKLRSWWTNPDVCEHRNTVPFTHSPSSSSFLTPRNVSTSIRLPF